MSTAVLMLVVLGAVLLARAVDVAAVVGMAATAEGAMMTPLVLRCPHWGPVA